MGQAKNRGTYEDRKAQAIAEGRSKEVKLVIGRQRESPKFTAHKLALMMEQPRQRRD